MVHIHNGILLNHKKNEIMPFAATWMDLEMIIPSEVSQREKDKYYVMGNLKYETDKLLYETETDSERRDL